jgi:uncharacterized protein
VQGRKPYPGMSRPSVRLLVIVLAVATVVGAAAGLTVAGSSVATSSSQTKEHRLVILIDSDDEKVMRHAISYAINLTNAYAGVKEKVRIEIVANGSGIRLFRADTSPLQQPLVMLRQVIPDIVFSVCDASRQIAEQREGRLVALIPEARLVPFGIRRIIELQEAGWSFVHG